MHEVLDIVQIVLVVVVSLTALFVVLYFSVNMAENIKKINNIKMLKKRMDTMETTALICKTSVEKVKAGKFRLIIFAYTIDEKTYYKKITFQHSSLNEVRVGDKIYIYYEKNNPENCILKENWEERTYKYYILWDFFGILNMLAFMVINVLMKLK